MSEDEQEQDNRPGWKDEVAVEGGICGLEAAGCCLLSMLNAIALLLIPVSALLMLNR